MMELETLPRPEARAPAKGGRLSKGAFLVLVWCALLHTFNVFVSLNMVTTTNVIYQRLYEPSEYGYLAAAVSQSVGYLLYPLAGLLAELRWTRYRTMMCGTALVATGSIVLIPATLLFPNKWTADPAEVTAQSEQSAEPMTVGLLLFQCGMAMFHCENFRTLINNSWPILQTSVTFSAHASIEMYGVKFIFEYHKSGKVAI